MVVGSTVPLTEMRTMKLPGTKVWPVREAGCLDNVGASTSHHMWIPMTCYKDSFNLATLIRKVAGAPNRGHLRRTDGLRMSEVV
jgi:hypothetical protein